MKLLVFRHVPHEHLGTIERILEEAGIGHEYVDLFQGASPPLTLEGYSGLVVMGGPMSVNEADRYPFLTLEEQLLREALEKELPVLGICLGAQLLAKALGARVRQNPRKEVGWYPLHLTQEGRRDSLFGSFGPEEMVFQWHGETFDLPRGAVHLASSPLCANQAFRYGRAYGFQFHLEVTKRMIEEWLEVPENCAELQALSARISPAGIIRDTLRFIERLEQLAEEAFGAFFKLTTPV